MQCLPHQLGKDSTKGDLLCPVRHDNQPSLRQSVDPADKVKLHLGLTGEHARKNLWICKFICIMLLIYVIARISVLIVSFADFLAGSYFLVHPNIPNHIKSRSMTGTSSAPLRLFFAPARSRNFCFCKIKKFYDWASALSYTLFS
jgi:hypothetical protein